MKDFNKAPKNLPPIFDPSEEELTLWLHHNESLRARIEKLTQDQSQRLAVARKTYQRNLRRFIDSQKEDHTESVSQE